MTERMQIPIKDIFSDDVFNCRGSIIPLEVDELAKSLKRFGLLQAIVVQPWDKVKGKKYRIVLGHRRCLAAKLLGWPTIDAVIREDLTDEEAEALNIVENIQREDLNMLQEARGVMRLLDRGHNNTVVAAMCNKSTAWVNVRVKLMTLPEDLQNEAAAGFLNHAQVLELAKLPLSQVYAQYRAIRDARARGESIVKPKKSELPKEKAPEIKIRERQELFDLQTKIREKLGNCFETEILGWAAGVNSTQSILKSLDEEEAYRGVLKDGPTVVCGSSTGD